MWKNWGITNEGPEAFGNNTRLQFVFSYLGA